MLGVNAEVLVADSIEALTPYYEDWVTLAGNAVETNVFFEPWMLIPALRHLSPAQGVQVVLVKDADNQRLIGLFPLVILKRYRHLPITSYCSWRYKYSANATPLIEKGSEGKCLLAFFRWLDQSCQRLVWTRFRLFVGDSPLFDELKAIATRQHRVIDLIEINKRAMLKTGVSGDAYFKRHISNKHQKEYRRLWNRLSDQGEIIYRQFDAGQHDLDAWLADFLELEGNGWKGRGGTAIMNNPEEKAFYVDAVHAAHKQACFAMSRLELGGDTIAGECSFMSNDGGVMLKIVYDENFARFSPGVLLVLKKTEQILDHSDIAWLDSCAVSDHPMINRLWKQQVQVRDFTVSGTRPVSRIALSAIKAMMAVKRRWSEALAR